MFKKFIQRIIEAKTQTELMIIFNGSDGVDMAFQKEKITWKEHQMLLDLINKLYDTMTE